MLALVRALVSALSRRDNPQNRDGEALLYGKVLADSFEFFVMVMLDYDLGRMIEDQAMKEVAPRRRFWHADLPSDPLCWDL